MKEKNISKVPKHIGVILDGNRRFAKRLMLKPWQGHEWGAKKVRKLMEWCEEFDIRELTLYALSVENFKTRPKKELDYLFGLFREEFENLMKDESFHKDKRIRVNFIGRLGMFPDDVQEKMQNLMDMTRDNGPYQVNFAMAYGGRAEVIDAVKRIAEQVKEGSLDVKKINEEVFDDNVYNKSRPDLIIRTSGEKRLSGFLLWQSGYAELAFVDKFWPDFEKEDFLKCVQEYSNRERRFGK